MKTSNSFNMIIDPQNLARIQVLTTHEVAFPNINYTNFEDLNRTRTTLLAAYTIINRKTPEYLNGLQWDSNGNIVWQNDKLGFLHADILRMIDNVDINNDHELRKIFVYIQLWGGNTGRGFFTRGGGFDANFNLEIYRQGINHIRIGKSIKALSLLNSLSFLSTAFSTKHMHFWSLGELPIYDSIIAKLVFGRPIYPYCAAGHYNEYIAALDDLIQELREVHNQNTTRRIIERNLFNWASTEHGVIWLANR
jgi:hypothetical protein